MIQSLHTGTALGYSAQEMADSPYAGFYDPELAPLPEDMREALLVGAQAAELFPALQQADRLLEPGYWPVETGYAVCADREVRVCALTRMPGVTPAMLDWWFAWHGSEGARYRLWHPRAHVDVAWADGRKDLPHYVGRTSRVVEYVGPTLFRLVIHFVAPATLGLNESQLRSRGETAICARIGLDDLPMLTGWLVHHVRPVADGAELRTRIWLGGKHLRPAAMPGRIGGWLGWLAGCLQPIRREQIHELMVHDAHEMNHLAQFLPGLYATFAHLPVDTTRTE